jgi:transmembrane sensor
MTRNGDNLERHIPKPVAEEAGLWDARLRAPDCSEADRARFAQWREADPSHRAAFERLQTMFAGLRSELSRADLRSLRDAALVTSGRRRRKLRIAAAASVAALAVAATLWTSLPDGLRVLKPAHSYVTGFGQRSTVTLQDGSSVELNAKTRIEVKFDSARRSVELLEGQALFRVARHAQRPFIVRAADREIVALGTAFDVRLDKRSVTVTLIEGKVSVDRAAFPAPAQKKLLMPGQQLLASFASGDAVRPIDVAKVTGWREGRVFLEDLTLQEAIAEMNRYSPVQIAVSDPALAQLRVNGMFRTSEQEAFVAALEDYFPLDAQRRSDTEIVLTPRK